MPELLASVAGGLYRLNIYSLHEALSKCGYKLVTFEKQEVKQKAGEFITT